MTLRRLEVRLLINTRQRGAKGWEGRGGGWGARKEVGRKEGEEENREARER